MRIEKTALRGLFDLKDWILNRIQNDTKVILAEDATLFVLVKVLENFLLLFRKIGRRIN